MPSPYPANPAATQPPSPAPGPRVLPVLSIPGGSEVRTIESITQQMKAKADFLGHIQSAVGLDVPVLNSGTSGFTAPSYSAFGGTVAPTGGVHIADGTRFVIQIQLGGAVGVATFKTSIDGGNTYGALQTTSASMTDATSGITLAFAGTLTAAGTATFRSAFTPLAEWSNQAGNLRQIIDHNGYRRGRVNEYYNDWMELGSGSVVGANNNTAGRLNWNIPAAANANCGWSSAIPGASSALQINGTNVANATTTRFYSVSGAIAIGSFVEAVLEFEVALTGQTATDIKVGFVGAGSTATGSPTAAATEIALCKQATDAHWQLVTSNGSSAPKIDTGIVPTALDRITMELYGSASPLGAVTARMFINDSLVVNATPATMVFVSGSYQFGVFATTTNATNGLTVAVSPVRCISNRYLSIPRI
jgi:hypothetical protein